MYLQPQLPGTVDQLLETDDGFKLWKYVPSKSEKTNAVGRWIVMWDLTPGSPGGPGPAGPDIDFAAKKGVTVDDTTGVVGGVVKREVTHELDFDKLTRVEDLL